MGVGWVLEEPPGSPEVAGAEQAAASAVVAGPVQPVRIQVGRFEEVHRNVLRLATNVQVFAKSHIFQLKPSTSRPERLYIWVRGLVHCHAGVVEPQLDGPSMTRDRQSARRLALPATC